MGASAFARCPDFRIFAFLLLLCCQSIPTRAGDSDFKGAISKANPINGEIVVVRVTLPKELQQPTDKPKLAADFDGIALPFYRASENDFEAILGIPYEHAAGPAKVKVTAGEGTSAKSIEIPFTVVEGEYPHETVKVPKKFAQPNQKALKRAAKEAKEVGVLYHVVTDKKYWDGPFAYPLKNVIIKSVYGTFRVYNEGVRKRPHYGTDFKAAIGTPVLAPSSGKIVLAKNLYFTGNTVLIDHGYGVITLYAHMNKLKVKKGDEVKAGQIVGLSGMTGQVTGPHVHWQCMIHAQKVNCEDLTKIMK